MPVQRPTTVTLNGNYTAGGTSLTFTDGSVNASATSAMLPGKVIAVDLELFLITGVPTGGSVAVSGGYLGSTNVNHTSGVLAYVNPEFTDFDILTAINNDLDDLCSPENGLYKLNSLEITYNPVITQYDLTDINGAGAVTGLIDLIAIRCKTPYPDRKYRAISLNDVELIPAMSVDTNFPSGYGLQLNNTRTPYPGQPINIIYKQSFTHLVNYTDNVQTVSGLPATANDLPPMGAMVSMVGPREVHRNQLATQPDPRQAPEVPPGAIMNSTNAVMRQRQGRINAESARLRQLNESRMRRR